MISEQIVAALKGIGVNLFVTLPCEKARSLISQGSTSFRHIALANEEEGVGICSGAFLAGARPAMLVQSSGVGHMINAICSLTKVYQLPLLVFVSWRGVYKEQIPAQIPLGKRLLKILSAIDVNYSIIESPKDIHTVQEVATKVYADSAIHTILLSPKIWEKEKSENTSIHIRRRIKREIVHYQAKDYSPALTRFQILEALSSYLQGKVVVCNLGIPCKELYHVKHQKSNFYMLGSMGLASSIGLGIASFTKKNVVVIEGDGSLLMNLGALSTVAVAKPRNLTILAIDNGVHGSTGNQPTATSFGADLELIAEGSGFDKIYKAATEAEITSTIENLSEGPNFVHILAKSGNADVPNIPLTPMEIKQDVMGALSEDC